MPKKPSLPPLHPDKPSRNGAEPVNPWDTHDPGYSPFHFYTRATNDKDHGEYRRVKFPPEVLAEMERIVQSGMVPEYESAQDLIRDAVIHRIRWLNEFRQVPLSPTGKMMFFRAELGRIEQRIRVRSAILQDIQRVAGSPGAQPSDQEAVVEIIRARLTELDPEDRQAILDDIQRGAPLHVKQLVERAIQEEA